MSELPPPAVEPPPAPVVPARAQRRWIVPAAIGLVAGGLAGVLLTRDGGDGGDKVDTTAIELPDTVGDFRSAADVAKDRGGAKADAVEAKLRTHRGPWPGDDQRRPRRGRGERTGLRRREPREHIPGGRHPGIRDRATGLVPATFGLAEDLGLAVPMEEVKTYGDVSCLILNPATKASEEVDTEKVIVEVCQRIDDNLTVRIQPGAKLAGPEAAQVVDELWADVAG